MAKQPQFRKVVGRLVAIGSSTTEGAYTTYTLLRFETERGEEEVTDITVNESLATRMSIGTQGTFYFLVARVPVFALAWMLFARVTMMAAYRDSSNRLHVDEETQKLRGIRAQVCWLVGLGLAATVGLFLSIFVVFIPLEIRAVYGLVAALANPGRDEVLQFINDGRPRA